MARYSKKAQEKISDVMHEMKKGKLKSGGGKKVTDRKQAIAIGISEAKEAGAKVPQKKSVSKSTRRSTPKAVKKTGKAPVSGTKKSAVTTGKPGPRLKSAAAKKSATKKKAIARSSKSKSRM